MLVALSVIALEQARPTASTMQKVKLFLDYAASQEEAVLTYHASDMILAIHSDASYLSEAKARSRAGGHFFMSNNNDDPPQQWSRPQHRPNHPSRHVFRRGSRNRRDVYQRARGCAHSANVGGTRASTAQNAHPNRQYSGRGSSDQQCPAKTDKGDGYAVPLAPRPCCAKTISFFLAARTKQSGGLLHQAFCWLTPQKCETRNPDALVSTGRPAPQTTARQECL